MRRLEDALKIVTDGNYCVKCHLVADYSPSGSNRAKAPNLADVFRRLRPDYTRDWIANPKMILPYTSMPVNIAWDPEDPEFGKFLGTKISQDLYHGNSIEQVDALVDLLMNYDRFTRDSTPIAGMVNLRPFRPKAGLLQPKAHRQRLKLPDHRPLTIYSANHVMAGNLTTGYTVLGSRPLPFGKVLGATSQDFPAQVPRANSPRQLRLTAAY
jgi:hypothetical protein